MNLPSIIQRFDVDQLRDRVRKSQPFPFFSIDNFLDEKFANRVLESFPSFEDAMKVGGSFNAVNEKGKVQLTDSETFAPAVRELNEVLSSQEWLDVLNYVMDIPKLLPDDELVGGGIHQTGPRGHLDVHVDFNYLRARELHRRLNILVYFNKDWKPEWGGNVEFWDKDVKVCHHSSSPIFNRCVVFATSNISYHGVTAVKCPEGNSRKSFAAYYYTKDPPPGWDGTVHSTIFKARPTEVTKKWLSMPMERARRKLAEWKYQLGRTLRGK
jgi:Rps23 Pro-64 3,4-dihydroxylase Tpa1-like proline 4-hydroxylase